MSATVTQHPSSVETAKQEMEGAIKRVTTPHLEKTLDLRHKRENLKKQLAEVEAELYGDEKKGVVGLETRIIDAIESGVEIVSRKYDKTAVETRLNPPRVSWLQEFIAVAGEKRADAIKAKAERGERKILVIC